MIDYYHYRWHNYTAIWYDLKTMSQAWNTVWLPSPYGYTLGASKEIYNSVSVITEITRSCVYFER